LTRRLATDLVRASGDRLDVYTRSLVEHSTESTEHDIAWLDRLIDAERQKQAASRTDGARSADSTDPSDPHSGDAMTSSSPTGAS
jgi:hypothetical protein